MHDWQQIPAQTNADGRSDLRTFCTSTKRGKKIHEDLVSVLLLYRLHRMKRACFYIQVGILIFPENKNWFHRQRGAIDVEKERVRCIPPTLSAITCSVSFSFSLFLAHSTRRTDTRVTTFHPPSRFPRNGRVTRVEDKSRKEKPGAPLSDLSRVQ